MSDDAQKTERRPCPFFCTDMINTARARAVRAYSAGKPLSSSVTTEQCSGRSSGKEEFERAVVKKMSCGRSPVQREPSSGAENKPQSAKRPCVGFAR